MSDLTELKLSDFDTCTCGDYRRDHKDGTGRCCMPDDLTHGFEPCLSFRLVKAATEVPPPFRALIAQQAKP
jgi:hypothetical protein